MTKGKGAGPSRDLEDLVRRSAELALYSGHGTLTMEHVFKTLLQSSAFRFALEQNDIDINALSNALDVKLAAMPVAEISRPKEGIAFHSAMSILAEKGGSADTADFLSAYLKTGFSSVFTKYLEGNKISFENIIADYADLLRDGVDEEEYAKPTASGKMSDNEYQALERAFKQLPVTDVCALVSAKKPVLVGRTEEVSKLVRVLLKKEKNNPILVGDPGVGKTAIIYGLAKMIAEGNVPAKLANNKIFSFEVGGLIAGTSYRGEFEQKLQTVLRYLSETEKRGTPCILVIDEIHTLVGSGSTGQGSLDGANILKPYLTSGEIKFIGATTTEEYKKSFEKDKALSRRFRKVSVLEPSVDEAIEIISGSIASYEAFHNVKYAPEAIASAVTLSSKYIHDRCLPDKAIDLLDDAGAQAVAINSEDRVISSKIIEKMISDVALVPVETVEKKEVDRLQSLAKDIKDVVFGQDEAIDKVVEEIQVSRAGLGDPEKPIASYLFVGPTGVGKTEVARTLAEKLDIPLIRFDMSEYMEEHSVAKLIGSPAGYVGYEDGGLLVDKIRKTPHCVLLLDEIEKAHTKVYNILLQVLDYGRLTDNQGNIADFKEVVIIMTSNAGAHDAHKASVGFISSGKTTNDMAIMDAVKNTFSPEFRARLSGTVLFNGLNDEMSEKIVNKYIGIFGKKLAKKKVSLTVSKSAREYLLSKSVSRDLGAREVSRVVEGELKPLFTKELLFGRLTNGGKATVVLNGDSLALKVGKIEKGE